ncbi:zf-HC2 domain-containing protein [Leucobacter chromiiresistens]|uniref:Anti-sigma factor, TIGR02949 family n=1 Tax=Leucobacter chromiiresistens TaxID=1079994 RepID=A0A1H1ADL3_9MICO|nr:zf-HC2 domain-containing protein [Leucobacter chromiiresistens]SDQ37795.1 anti-sigma factor, TIGR02949 family [Leucobacter chromiiresistens]
MNECEQAKANVYELLRGELCAEESAPIRAHIAECPSCQDERNACEKLTNVVKRACEEERDSNCPPEALRDAILRSLRAEGPGAVV